MVELRKRPRGVRYHAPFGLCVLAMGLVPRSIGYQDLVALMARQTEVSQRARAHMMASPFGTIHAATFSFPQPLGTMIPDLPAYQLASVSTTDPETTGALGEGLTGAPLPPARSRAEFPAVNRRLKGDLLVTRPREDEQPPAQGTRDLTPGRVKTVSFPKPTAVEANDTPPREQPANYAVASLEPSVPAGKVEQPAQPSLGDTEVEGNAASRLGRLYFGNTSGEGLGTIQPWPAEEELLIEAPPARDPDLKRTASASPLADDFNFETASAASAPDVTAPAGETVAAKGEVTGDGKRPKSPAERLNLSPKQRASSEKCLAEAVYFESRGEVKRGQITVAQVVMNRVFSGFYPNSVCGTVYQNAHRKMACQFTFACDGIPDKIEEPDMWEQAKEIAHDMLDGKIWLPEIGHSTHYHAYWVHPSWVNEMRKIYKIGVHSFYRPRAWGDAVEVPNHPFVAPQAKL
jgi:spore germination cell wall hydrolase CwlJ-like protein